MTARYVLTPQAKQDLAEIADHIAESSGLALAEQVLSELRGAFSSWLSIPKSGMFVPTSPTIQRCASGVSTPTSSHFVPAARPLAVVSILHGARDPKNIAEHIRDARASGE